MFGFGEQITVLKELFKIKKIQFKLLFKLMETMLQDMVLHVSILLATY
jgi:hypothetical protein